MSDLVLAGQAAAIAVTRDGTLFTQPHDSTFTVLAQGLLDLRLLDAKNVGRLDDALEKRA